MRRDDLLFGAAISPRPARRRADGDHDAALAADDDISDEDLIEDLDEDASLGVGKMRLLASPRKMPSMAGYGLEVTGFISKTEEN